MRSCLIFKAKGYPVPQDKKWLEKMLATLQERAKTLTELVDAAHYYLSDEIALEEKAAKKFLTTRRRRADSELDRETSDAKRIH